MIDEADIATLHLQPRGQEPGTALDRVVHVSLRSEDGDDGKRRAVLYVNDDRQIWSAPLSVLIEWASRQ